MAQLNLQDVAKSLDSLLEEGYTGYKELLHKPVNTEEDTYALTSFMLDWHNRVRDKLNELEDKHHKRLFLHPKNPDGTLFDDIQSEEPITATRFQLCLSVLENIVSELKRQPSETVELSQTEKNRLPLSAPLKWDTKRRQLCWAKNCHVISPQLWGLVLFLDVLSRYKGQVLNNEELRTRYNAFCDAKREEFTDRGLKVPKRYRKAYSELPALAIGKMAYERVKELRRLFKVPEGKSFPIHNQSSIEIGGWIWDKTNPRKAVNKK